MRSFIRSIAALTAAVAPMAVLAADNTTTYYLQTPSGSYFSYQIVSEGIVDGYLETDTSYAYPVAINSTTGWLTLDNTPDFEGPIPVTLSDEPGQGDLYSVFLDFSTPTTGWSWASNGSLLVDVADFNGFYACDENEYGTQLFWAASATSTPSGCESVTFARVAA